MTAEVAAAVLRPAAAPLEEYMAGEPARRLLRRSVVRPLDRITGGSP
jgi:hypothetical protein